MDRLVQLERKREAIVPPVVATVSTIALISVVVALQETLAIGLLILIRVTVSSVPSPIAVVTVTVAIEVRTLRIVVLASRGVVFAGVKSVLITLASSDLIHVVVSAISPIPVIAITVTPIIRILVVRPVLRTRGRNHANAHQKRQCQQDSPDPAAEKV